VAGRTGIEPATNRLTFKVVSGIDDSSPYCPRSLDSVPCSYCGSGGGSEDDGALAALEERESNAAAPLLKKG